MLLPWNSKNFFYSNDDNQNTANVNIESQIESLNKLLEDTKSFTSFINDVIDLESKEIFPDILKLSRMDFFDKLKSNILNILSKKYTNKIFEIEKCNLILAKCLQEYEPTYKNYTEELNNAWDKYQSEILNKKINDEDIDIEDNKNYLTNFRKHCIKTDNIAIHKCNKNEKGYYIIVYDTTSSKNNNSKMKYVICENCHKTYPINSFENYCQNCDKIYYSSPLEKNENENIFPAALESPHCDIFFNQKLLCERCNGVLYINLKSEKLECMKCLYNKNINDQKEWKWKCNACNEKFESKIKIFNPVEVKNFKFIIKKALVYQIKAHPTKLSCSRDCKKIDVNSLEFYHKKNCDGILYFAEYDNKKIIICKKCLAINMCKRFIWICPICGLHFRDIKYLENVELKMRKTKSSKKFGAGDYQSNTKNNNNKSKKSLADLILKKQNKEKEEEKENKIDDEIKNKRGRSHGFKKEDNTIEKKEENIINNNDIKINGRRRYIFNKFIKGHIKYNNIAYSSQKATIETEQDENENKEKKEIYNKKENDIITNNNQKPIMQFLSNGKMKSRQVRSKYKNNFESTKSNDDIIKTDINIKPYEKEREKLKQIRNKNEIKENEKDEQKKIKSKDKDLKKEKNEKINQNNKIKNDGIESWKSKNTTSKGSNGSKNSESSNENNEKKNKNLEDIIKPEFIDFFNDDIEVEDEKIKEDEKLYNHIQRRLKKVLAKGNLPRFNMDNYTIVKKIGDGAFGSIYEIYNNKTKIKYAIKEIIANNIVSLEGFQKEFEIVYQNPHENILDIYGICVKCINQNKYILYVLMDLADLDWEVEINEKAKNKNYYSENELIYILKQVYKPLTYLQKEKQIAHRDIKAENILIFNNNGKKEYKICDFGEAKETKFSKKHKTLRGTELYMSPLLYNGLLHDEQFVEHDAYKSDVFSLGCCIIIAAVLNFDIINEIRELKEQIKIKKFLENKFEGRYSDKLIDIILKMINFNEKERIDFIELDQLVESDFP